MLIFDQNKTTIVMRFIETIERFPLAIGYFRFNVTFIRAKFKGGVPNAMKMVAWNALFQEVLWGNNK